jgi:LysR family transcriptional regulator, transcriptional activator of nhaA
MLNYKQLYYFWNVAKYGGVTRAAEQLHLTPQTISGQVSDLAQSLGVELFYQSGRRLKLTAAGDLAFTHAEEIFQTGKALEARLKHNQHESGLLLRVGVSNVVPKSIAFSLLSPALDLAEPVRLNCYEDKLDSLFAELAIHNLDLVIADRPLSADTGVKGYNHLLGECALAFYGVPELAEAAGSDFPQSLQDAPLLMPGPDSALQPALERWFEEIGISPHIKAEFDDSGLMKAFGQEGIGLFPAPEVIAQQAARQHGVQVAGVTEAIACRYYAITPERRLKHPALEAISRSAHKRLFGSRVNSNRQ